MNVFDIKRHEQTCAAINAIIQNKGTAEVKVEARKDGTAQIVVVETKRGVKSAEAYKE